MRYLSAMDVPDWLERARSGWKNTGSSRPDFAETPGPGQESVWDYPRPPALVPDDREVVVRSGALELARSRRTVRVLETASPPTFYVPIVDVDTEQLRPMPGRSMCEWKGEAQFWGLRHAAEGTPPVGWSYPTPFPEFAAIGGYICFYPSRVDCSVDGETVTSQPGGFYGGWVTSEIVGPWKGGPGSSGW